MALSASAWKGLSMAVFTLLSLAGFAAAILLRERANQLWVSSGVMFSAGVLLAGGLVHLLGDSTEGFEEAGATSFPWSYAVSGLTVAVLVCVEMVVRDVALRRAEAGSRAKNEKQEQKPDLGASGTSQPSEMKVVVDPGGSAEDQSKDTKEIETKAVPVPTDGQQKAGNQRPSLSKNLSHQDLHAVIGNEDIDPLTAVVLTIALSIHTVIEGIGVGATDDVSAIRSSFVAIAFHKSFTAYALANSLVECGYWGDPSKRKYFYASTGLFVGLTLVGIGVGWALSAATGGLGSAIVVAVTSGSFLYVAAIEIIPDELETIGEQRLQTPLIALSFLGGYCLMSMLAIWA